MTKSNPATSAARYILVATALLLPTLSLVPLGGLYLWEKGLVLWWALAALVCIGVVTLLQRVLIAGAIRRPPPEEDRKAPTEPGEASLADPTWSPLEAKAWADVKVVASRVDLERMNDLDAVITLGRNTIEVVAERLHPTREDAIWQFTLPEALAITERVSRRLGRMIETNVPFGDRMTVSQFIGIYQWRHMLDAAERAYDIWRLVRLVNPATAITNEARERLSRALFQWGREHVMRRLVEAYVEEVGRAAIDLYGGRLRIARVSPDEAADAPESVAAMARTPITVLVAGGTAEARETTAAILRMVEQDEASAMLASLDRKDPSASTWDLVGLEVRLSEADVAAGKHTRHLVDEVAGADIVVWALPGGIVTEQQRTALAAIAEHFKTTPSLLAPAVLPIELKGVAPSPVSGEKGAALSGEELIVMAPVVIDPKSANPEADGKRLAEALRRSYAHARRVKAVRWLSRMKAQRNYVGAGRQAASAIGSAVRSIFSRRSS
jgi:hypothetical protein